MSEKCHERKSGALFDHLLGERQQGRGHDDAERFRGLEIDDQKAVGPPISAMNSRRFTRSPGQPITELTREFAHQPILPSAY